MTPNQKPHFVFRYDSEYYAMMIGRTNDLSKRMSVYDGAGEYLGMVVETKMVDEEGCPFVFRIEAGLKKIKTVMRY